MVLFCFVEICFRLQILSKMLKNKHTAKPDEAGDKLRRWLFGIEHLLVYFTSSFCNGSGHKSQIIGCCLGNRFFSLRLETSSCLFTNNILSEGESPHFSGGESGGRWEEGIQAGSWFQNLAKLTQCEVTRKNRNSSAA